MNQILETKQKNKKLFRLFKLQFIISFVALIILFMYISRENKLKAKEKEITNIVNINAKITTIFKSENYENINENHEDNSYENEIYLCKLKIEKIDLEYFVYSSYSEELLKILPCKFYGESLGEYGNICIIGHNYFDNRFFSNLNKLGINDEIILEDLQGKEYKFYVYDIREIDDDNIDEIIKSVSNKKTITLCTCTINKNRRLIIKAKA